MESWPDINVSAVFVEASPMLEPWTKTRIAMMEPMIEPV
jgi:hypothetical protein